LVEKERKKSRTQDHFNNLISAVTVATAAGRMALNERFGVDDGATWWLIRVVFWSIVLFVAIRLVAAMVFAS
jgi:hypothetical protein